MIECFNEGLYYRGIVHDLSKFLPSEFVPYANHFFGNKIKDEDEDKDFEKAWFYHQKRNKHHWQYWIMPLDKNGLKIITMDEPYLTEMICDWVGAEKAQGKFSPKNDKYLETKKWYKKNSNKMQISKNTKNKIEKKIGISKE